MKRMVGLSCSKATVLLLAAAALLTAPRIPGCHAAAPRSPPRRRRHLPRPLGASLARASGSHMISIDSPAQPTAPLAARGGGGAGPAGLVAYIQASKARCWATLVVSIMIESTATTLNKRAADTRSGRLFAGSCLLFLLCVAGFNVALSQIDVSVAYALWSALGTVLVATSGVLFFGEPCDAAKLACLALIVAGVVGLNVRDAPH